MAAFRIRDLVTSPSLTVREPFFVKWNYFLVPWIYQILKHWHTKKQNNGNPSLPTSRRSPLLLFFFSLTPPTVTHQNDIGTERLGMQKYSILASLNHPKSIFFYSIFWKPNQWVEKGIIFLSCCFSCSEEKNSQPQTTHQMEI